MLWGRTREAPSFNYGEPSHYGANPVAASTPVCPAGTEFGHVPTALEASCNVACGQTGQPAHHRPLYRDSDVFTGLSYPYLSFYVQQGRNIVKNRCNDWGKRGLPPIPGENRATIARLLLVCDKRDILLPNRQKKAKILAFRACQTCSCRERRRATIGRKRRSP
jgi:hypothetical protein